MCSPRAIATNPSVRLNRAAQLAVFNAISRARVQCHRDRDFLDGRKVGRPVGRNRCAYYGLASFRPRLTAAQTRLEASPLLEVERPSHFVSNGKYLAS